MALRDGLDDGTALRLVAYFEVLRVQDTVHVSGAGRMSPPLTRQRVHTDVTTAPLNNMRKLMSRALLALILEPLFTATRGAHSIGKSLWLYRFMMENYQSSHLVYIHIRRVTRLLYTYVSTREEFSTQPPQADKHMGRNETLLGTHV